MWNAIATHIGDALGRDFPIQQRQRITGGDIHQTFMIEDDHCRLFIKIAEKRHRDVFEQEALCLSRLKQQSFIRIPEVLIAGATAANAFIAMEYLELNEGSPARWFEFGQNLAKLHRDHQQGEYGFDDDNYIGINEQPNRWQRHWGNFFAEQRIGWQLRLAQEKGYRLVEADSVIRCCQERLANHKPEPSLLHGDLWRGNVGFCDERAVLFDPACYYGDRETDLAMSELFSRFPDEFYRGYDAEWPLANGYQQRAPVYQLYHLLNHLNLFGESYLPSCKSLIKELIQ